MAECKRCKGSGSVGGFKCTMCDGTGDDSEDGEQVIQLAMPPDASYKGSRMN
jgi:DnaJ-class molecular chaperone